MKDLITYVIGGSVILIFIVGALWVSRTVTNVTTPIHVAEVEAGIKCATITSADGVAIDCWRVE